MATKRKAESWIGGFLGLTALHPSSERFRQWSSFSAIAAALQRRVFCRIFNMKLYPNLYIVLVAGPGGGKSVAINLAREFAEHTSIKNYVRVAADSTTRESFFQQMEACFLGLKFLTPKTSTVMDDIDRRHSSLNIMSSEFGSFLSTRNMEFIRALSDLYDCERPGGQYKYLLKNAASSNIQYPWLNMIAGTTPTDLVDILPRQAMGQGFTSRLIMVYSEEEYDTDDVFQSIPKSREVFDALLEDYKMLLTIEGEYKFTKDGKIAFNEWYIDRKNNQPANPLLVHYCARRIMHLGKLCMVVSASRKQELVITGDDVETALSYLLDAEVDMPNALKGMGLNPLADQVPDAIMFVRNIYRETKKPVPERLIKEFLRKNIPLDKVWVYLKELGNYCIVTGEQPTRLFEPYQE